MKITFKQLRLFLAVASQQNLSHGAQVCFLSQPAASMALSELETRLGTSLFDRIGKKLVLNANGIKLYPFAAELVERLHSTENLFGPDPGQLSGHLRIGTSSTIGNYFMPAIIHRFCQRYPAVRISQTIHNTQTILHDLEQFHLDIGLIEGACDSDSLTTQLWQKDTLVIFASTQNPLQHKKNLRFSDLSDQTWVLRERGSGTRECLEKVLRIDKIHLEIGSTHAIKQLVAANMGIGCASRAVLQEEIARGQLVELAIKDGFISRDFLHVSHKAKYQTDLIKAFNQVLFGDDAIAKGQPCV